MGTSVIQTDNVVAHLPLKAGWGVPAGVERYSPEHLQAITPTPETWALARQLLREARVAVVVESPWDITIAMPRAWFESFFHKPLRLVNNYWDWTSLPQLPDRWGQAFEGVVLPTPVGFDL